MWNTAERIQEADGRAGLRAFSVEELQAFFDCADELVVLSRQRGRTGWLSGFRDITLFKVAYAWGLLPREVGMLEMEDFGVNTDASDLGSLGVVCVPMARRRRARRPSCLSVLFGWAAECLEEWLSEIRPRLARSGTRAGGQPSVEDGSARTVTKKLRCVSGQQHGAPRDPASS